MTALNNLVNLCQFMRIDSTNALIVSGTSHQRVSVTMSLTLSPSSTSPTHKQPSVQCSSFIHAIHPHKCLSDCRWLYGLTTVRVSLSSASMTVIKPQLIGVVGDRDDTRLQSFVDLNALVRHEVDWMLHFIVPMAQSRLGTLAHIYENMGHLHTYVCR